MCDNWSTTSVWAELAELLQVGACKATKPDLDRSRRCFGGPRYRKDFAYLELFPPHKWNQSMATASGGDACRFAV